jgi:hypothetical protein
MATNPGQTVPPRRRRWLRKRTIVLGVAALLAAVLVWLVVRGTWADTAPRNPQSSAEGAVAQLYQEPDGRKLVRAALVIDRPADEVWKVVTDYDHFAETFPYERSLQGEREPGDRYHLSGVLHSQLYGDWAFDVRVRHEETAEGRVASWEGPTPDLPVHRGSWTVTPLGPDRTLLALAVEMQLRGYPQFWTHNILLNRVKPMVRAVDQRLKTRPEHD